MTIAGLSIRNMTGRPLATLLSLVLLALGVGLVILLMQINRHIDEQTKSNLRGVDMVIGAKGSPLQLILSSVYHIDDPTGNIDYKQALKIQKSPWVEVGIPLSFGDSYQGYRIVGTSHQYPELYEADIAQGRLWQAPLEVALGHQVAEALQLSIGDTFHGAHGLTGGIEVHEEHTYTVVGRLNATNSVIDQLILTATESVWAVHHHGEHAEEAHTEHDDHANEEEGHKEHEVTVYEEEQEITAMLVKFRNPIGMVQLPRMINQDTNIQAAVPVYEMNRLFSLIGMGINTLGSIALVIIAVSGLSVFISLYNALKDRQYEMALLRTYGATRWQLARMVLQEGTLITLTGFTIGLLLSRIGLWVLAGLVSIASTRTFSGWLPGATEGWVLLVTLTIGALASILPAIRVFHLNISKTLARA